jgi:hypothetical protein
MSMAVLPLPCRTRGGGSSAAAAVYFLLPSQQRQLPKKENLKNS